VGSAQNVAEPSSDGTHAISAAGLEIGMHELIVSVRAAEGDDLLAGTLDISSAAQNSTSSHSELDHIVAILAPLGRSSSVLLAATLLLGAVIGFLLARRRVKVGIALLAIGSALAADISFAGPGGEGHTHGDEQAVAIASDAPQRLPDGSVFLPKPTQRLLEVRTLQTQQSEVRRTVSLPGRVIGSPNQSGVVQSINGGRIAVPDGGLPRLGQRVRKGQLLALVEAPINAADETTIADKLGEINQQISIAEIRLQRLAPLAASNAIPKTQVIDLEAELEALRRRRAEMQSRRRRQEELRAPIDGEIAISRVVAGQVVAAQDQIFQIVDSGALWVEAFVFGELDPASIGSAAAVSNHGPAMELRLQGVGRAMQLHAINVQFSITSPPPSLVLGQPVTVLVQMPEPVKGIVLPREAAVRAANGEMIVWQHVAPERFTAKPVRIEPLDGNRVAIVAGLEQGQRIVVKGAELINQIR
jgi:RND family efflux transporter MFP subunit